MKALIKELTVYDKRSPYFKKKINVVVNSGKIVEVSEKKISGNYREISGNNLVLTPSLIDINAQSGTFNNTESETLISLQNSAKKGGISHIVHLPTENYPIVRKSDINHLVSVNQNTICQILPTGSIYDENKGTLTEMMQMKAMGAVAFSNGNKPISDNKYLRLALEYVKGFGGKLMIHPEKAYLTHNGQVNQSIVSTKMGYKGIPKSAEIISVEEILELIEYTDSEALLYNLTCPKSIAKAKNFNKSKKRAFTSLSTAHLALNQEDCLEYDSNFKLSPPLRDKQDVKKIIDAALKGEVDILYSQHIPVTTEGKVCEFDLADFGIINAQTSLLLALEIFGVENMDKIADMMSLNPAAFLGVDMPVFDNDIKGNFTIIDTESKTHFSKESNLSQSNNSPFLDREFSSRVVGMIANGKEEFFDL